jgi:lipoprotein-releasing system permease protein
MVLKFRSEPIDNYTILQKKIEESANVVKASPYIFTKTMIKGRKNRIDGIMVRGELGSPDIKNNIIWGEYNTEENGIVLGKNLADMLGVFIRDTVTLYGFPYGKNPGLLNLRSENFIVRGIFDIGLYDFNSSLAYTSLPLLQDFFSLGDRITGIEVKVDDIDNADGIAKTIEKGIGYPYYVTSWKELNTNLFAALSLEKFTMFLLLTLVIVVAAFNIIATLLMTVIGKTREIGILLSIGASPSSIRKIFVLQGLIMGIIGTFMGIAIGWTACELLSKYQFIKIPADIYNINTLPVSMQLSDFLIVPIATICISLLASLYPAWRASKLEPVEAIRYE